MMIKKYLRTVYVNLIVIAVCCSIAEAQDATAAPSVQVESEQEDVVTAEAGRSSYWDDTYGFFSFQWQNKYGSEADNDLYQTLYLNYQPTEANDWKFVTFGRLSEDLKKDREVSKFADFSDTFNNNVDARLYYAYVEINNAGFINPDSPVNRVTVGRQEVSGTGRQLHFDGLKVDSHVYKDIWNLQVGAYGGRNTNFYEFDNNAWLVGTSVQVSPRVDLRLRADQIHISDEHKEENKYGQDLDGNQDDNYVFSAWYTGIKNINLFSRYSILDSEGNNFNLRTTYSVPEENIILQINYTTLIQSLLNRSNPVDPFTTVTSVLQPYHRITINLWKEFFQRYSFDLGFTARKLKDDANEGLYNHDYKMYYLTHNTIGFLTNKLNLMLSANYWDGSGRNDQFTSGGELNYALEEGRIISGGVYYDLFKYNEITNDDTLVEKENVYTFFGRVEWKLTEVYGMKIKNEYEKSKFGNYNYFSLEFNRKI